MTVQQGLRAASLHGLCGGAVHLPGDPAYDLARTPWNLQVSEHPAAVAYPADATEVAEVVRAARAAGLAVACQGTGHGAAALQGRLAEAVLLRTSAMNEVSIDAERRTARVGAGVLWGDLTQAAGHHGLAALHPSSPNVGVVGYSLGGGLSWYARRLGLQCNTVTAAELVLADGTFVRATADQETDLFWAVRGGGTPLGVVCALEFGLEPLDSVVSGYLAWDWVETERVFSAWVRWCADAPESVTTALRVVAVPDAEDMPAEVRGRNLVLLDGAVSGTDSFAAEVWADLRALGPEVDSLARVPASSVIRMHLDPEGPAPAYASSTLVSELPDEAVAAIVAAVGPQSGSILAMTEIRQLGGALSRPAPDGGALSSVDGAFLALGVGLETDPADWDRQRADAARLLAAVEPWATGRTYLPMVDDSMDTRKAFPPEVHARLSEIRRTVDPRGLFMAPHPSPPLPSDRT